MTVASDGVAGLAGADRGLPRPAAGERHARRSSPCRRAPPRCCPRRSSPAAPAARSTSRSRAPTRPGSFKDRGMTMAITKAVEEGAKAVICASTGNTSASAAAYAARAGLTCAVLVPQGKIAMGKLAQALVHGAKLLQVEGNFDDCLALASKLAIDYPVSLVNSVNQYRIEGQKTASFEIVDVLGDAPDIHCLPVGNAGNITAYWQGYREYAADAARLPDPAHVGLPGRRRGADRHRQGRGEPEHDRHRDPDRQSRVVDEGARRPRRVRRPHRRRHRPRDPRRLPAARPQRGRLRRARVGGLGRRACCRSPRPASSSPASGWSARSPATGSRTPSGRSPARPRRRPSRSTPPRPRRSSGL